MCHLMAICCHLEEVRLTSLQQCPRTSYKQFLIIEVRCTVRLGHFTFKNFDYAFLTPGPQHVSCQLRKRCIGNFLPAIA